MRIKIILAWAGGMILLCMFLLIVYLYPFYRFFFTSTVQEIAPDLLVISGAGNSTVIVTDSAVAVIDTKMGPMAKKLHNFAEEKAGDKPVIVINTHYHGDHIFGNRYFKGSSIYIGGYPETFARANIKEEDMPSGFITDSLVLNLGNETLVLLNTGQGHTFDDLVVYLRNHRTLVAGDLVFNKIHPALMKDAGANVESWQKILEQVSLRWPVEKVIPGHGDPGDVSLIGSQSAYFDDMRLAATNPEKRIETKNKYSEWMAMPFMASADKTIEFLIDNPVKH